MSTPMLLSAVLAFNALPPDQSTGSHAHAWFLNLVDHFDHRLAADLHANGRLKPFTISPLCAPVRPDQPNALAAPWLRVTTLDDRLGHFVASLRPDAVGPVRLGTARLRLSALVREPWRHPWANQTSYAHLVARAAAESGPPARVALRFHTPAAFGSDQHNVNALFPEPRLVWTSLGRRWNAHAEPALKLDEGFLDEIGSRARVERYSLETRETPLKGRVTKGFIGDCEFSLGLDAPLDARRVLSLLAEFAFYAGLGMRTTMGMGQVTRA